MTIAVVGPRHETVPAWLVDLLAKHDTVSCFSEGELVPGSTRLEEALDCTRALVWDARTAALTIAQKVPERLVYAPAIRSKTSQRRDWQAFAGIPLLSFSWALHHRLRRRSLSSYHTQYFPDPAGYTPVSDFSTLRGYLRQKREGSSWKQMSKRSGDLVWEEFSAGRTNIYFDTAGDTIDHGSLEAMAMGMCVAAPENAAIAEYLSDQTTGLLYDPRKITPLDISRAAEIGAAARRRAEHGFADWIFDRDERLPEIILSKGREHPTRTRAQAEWHRPQTASPDISQHKSGAPKITVAIVTLNAEETLEETLRSVREQTYSEIEIVVVDGCSTDGTADIIDRHRAAIATSVSLPPQGPYDAMNHAARISTGEFIIYMNAGDLFASRDALRRAACFVSGTADFIFGDHIHVTTTRDELWHKAPPFEQTWLRLQNGELSRAWLAGIPCHQATLTRRTMLLMEGGYDTAFLMAADHDFLFRMYRKGKRFVHCAETLAIYAGGGLSEQRNVECVQEWWRIARAYGASRRVDRFFRAKFPPACEIGPWTFSVTASRAFGGLKRLLRSITRWRVSGRGAS